MGGVKCRPYAHGVMVSRIFTIFFALVALYFVLMYPGHVVDILQFFVDGARRVARALSQLDLHTGK